MTINSVTSSSDIYEAMVQQAAALRAAQENQASAARAVPSLPGQTAAGKSTEAGSFAQNLSTQTHLTEQGPLALPAPAGPESQQFPKRAAAVYRSPWPDAHSLVIQSRAPSGLTAPSAAADTIGDSAPPPKSDAPKPTFVEVHSVYVDAADEESGRSSRNPLIQFASQLYRNVVTSSQRSSAGVFVGSSFSAVA